MQMRKGRFWILLLAGMMTAYFWGMISLSLTAHAESLPGFGDNFETVITPAPSEQPVGNPTAPPPGSLATPYPASTYPPSGTPKPGGAEVTDKDNGFIISDNRLISYRGSKEKVTIPSSVTSISYTAFSNNQNVRAVVIPATVKRIESGAFNNCPYLRYLVFEGNTSVEQNAVYRCVRFTNISAGKNTKAYRYAKKYKIPVVVTQKPKMAISSITLLAGDTKKNELYNTYESTVWKSSKNNVLTVSDEGSMKAVRAGKVKVTATVNGISYTCKVTVLKRTNKNRVVLVSKKIIKKKMSRYQKIKAVHNWMIANVKYDYDSYLAGFVPPVSHSATGALMKGVAVCDGYAHAFKIFMKYLKIPCKFVVGKSGTVGHGWNMVKVNGKWYHIDVTFDDPIVNGSNENTKPYYTFFLKSSSKMRKSHKWKASKYPRCKSKKYD